MSDLDVQRQIRDIAGRLERLEKLESGVIAGTYVPTYTGGASVGVTTYSEQSGFYVRVGNIIFFTGRVTWTAATGTGNARISLPFTTQNTTGLRYSGSVRVATVTFANSSPEMRIEANDTAFLMDSPLTNAASTTVQVEAAGDVIFSGFFFV